MTRTQLYLPDEVYEQIKLEAKQKNMSFAGYVRLHFESSGIGKKKKMTLEERYPFIGMFKWGKNAANNDEIDKFLLDEYAK